ncbi:50S ribosomal protein L37e [Candidatus Woesearchaeota archaeon]|nr:50S ribosomal protein L37e [Candidatus Woesearchaeota archaeon]
MTKGTASHGRKTGKKTHIQCRRCGGHSFHIHKKRCGKCGYGATPHTRKYNWNKKITA